MKAIIQDRYGEADVLEFRDVEEPVVGEHDVLIRVRAAGAGPDVWHIMTGKPYIARPALGWSRPKIRIRGWDVAGTVEAVGSAVTEFEPGDEVMGVAERGSFAELTVAPGRTSSSASPSGSRSSRLRRFRSRAPRPSRPSATRDTCGPGSPCW